MSDKINISINDRQKTLKGWRASVVIICVLILAGVGLLQIASAAYVSLF